MRDSFVYLNHWDSRIEYVQYIYSVKRTVWEMRIGKFKHIFKSISTYLVGHISKMLHILLSSRMNTIHCSSPWWILTKTDMIQLRTYDRKKWNKRLYFGQFLLAIIPTQKRARAIQNHAWPPPSFKKCSRSSTNVRNYEILTGTNRDLDYI